MLALRQQAVPFLAYSIPGTENASVVAARSAACAGVAETVAITSVAERFQKQLAFLQTACEPFRYWSVEEPYRGQRRGKLVSEDNAAVGLSTILTESRPTGGLIYLSGSGADEILSDYAIDGDPVFCHSCFRGVFPRNLSTVFPWCSFYKGTQRNYLMKEELVAGAHGVEGRYPFLDPKVVQEYLWLSADVKNSEYKRPVADYLRAFGFPNAWKQKIGFNVLPDASFIAPTAAMDSGHKSLTSMIHGFNLKKDNHLPATAVKN